MGGQDTTKRHTMADQQSLSNTLQPFYHDDGNDETAMALVAPQGQMAYGEYIDFPTHGFDDENTPSDWLLTWSATWSATWPDPWSANSANTACYASQIPFPNSNLTSTTTTQHAQSSTSGYSDNAGSYSTPSTIESGFLAMEPHMLAQSPIAASEERKNKATSESAKYYALPKLASPTAKHSRKKSLKRVPESPSPPRFVPDDPGGADDEVEDEVSDPLNEQTAEDMRRHRNREATKKSQQKKKKHFRDLARHEQRVSAKHNCLREERETLQWQALRLREEILQHRDCGSGMIDAYIEASAWSLARGGDGLSKSTIMCLIDRLN